MHSLSVSVSLGLSEAVCVLMLSVWICLIALLWQVVTLVLALRLKTASSSSWCGSPHEFLTQNTLLYYQLSSPWPGSGTIAIDVDCCRHKSGLM